MKSRRHFLSAAMLLGLALMLTVPMALAQAIDEYSGVETFMRFCASCHGATGEGNGPVAGALPIQVPNLTLLRARDGDKFSEDVLRKIIDGREPVIIHGTRYMPVWGYEFWVEEGADEPARERVDMIVANLIDYISSIQKQP